MKRLYLSDLDGTLLDSRGKLKARSALLLQRLIDNGAVFSYSTARRFVSAGIIMKDVDINVPVSLMNGTIIADGRTGKPIEINFIDPAAVTKIREYFLENNETPLVYAMTGKREHASYLENDMECNLEYVKARAGDSTLRAVTTQKDLYEGEIFYLTLNKPRSDLNKMKMFLSEINCGHVIYRDIYHDDRYLCEISPANATKGSAALKIKNMIGAEELYVFGDSENDLPMFAAADKSFAVKNAQLSVKSAADMTIPSNDSMGVPYTIEQIEAQVWHHEYKDSIEQKPDCDRFNEVLCTLNRNYVNIGTLNEGTIHAALKAYYADNLSHEAKIGDYYADILSENGIIEIQSANFVQLKNNLNHFLSCSHVTVVYPYHKIVHSVKIDEQTGEISQKIATRKNNDLTDFFLELYRIKEFLTDPNLSIIIAELEINRVTITKNGIRKRVAAKKEPVSLLREIFLQKTEDYRYFLPKDLPEMFTKAQFAAKKPHCEAGIMLEILEYTHIVHKSGKIGNSILFSETEAFPSSF